MITVDPKSLTTADIDIIVEYCHETLPEFCTTAPSTHPDMKDYPVHKLHNADLENVYNFWKDPQNYEANRAK